MGAVDALCVSCGHPMRWTGGPRKCMACMITHREPRVSIVDTAVEIVRKAGSTSG